jgi:succinate-semialdehyde dehydrogenase / glutarate-semialdehyde dehydrogenase
MGKRIAESRGEVELSASILRYYADNAETFLAPRPLKSIAGEAYIEYSPLGVLIGVQPWNYPYYQLARFAAPHLASGNVMLVKHAPGVPQCALAFEQLFREAGAPSGAYTKAFLSNDQVAKLIDDPRTRGVALTGSERAGESLASRAGKNLKKSTMELGGSDPFIVLEDYDLEDAVKMAVVGRIGNTGQTCIGAKRFIFIGPRLNQFLTMFRTALESLKIGDPFDEATTLGPLSSEAALTLLLKQVDEAVAHGAKVLTGGKRVDRKGSFMQATILTNITPDNPAYKQEFFGPVALVLPAKNEEEAIAIANDSPFGLGGSIYTKDIERAVVVIPGDVALRDAVEQQPRPSAPLPELAVRMSEQMSDALWRWSDEGKLPVVVDAASCTHLPARTTVAWLPFDTIDAAVEQGAVPRTDAHPRHAVCAERNLERRDLLGSDFACHRGLRALFRSVRTERPARSANYSDRS